MNTSANPPQRRILLIDDNVNIHEAFREIFAPSGRPASFQEEKARLFGGAAVAAAPAELDVVLEYAPQGQAGLGMVKEAREAKNPYQVAFVDMRMPPGWDGLTTIEQLWRADARLQVVICTAYTDHSLADITQRLGRTDKLIILKKPFDNIEVIQLAHTLCEKWHAERRGEGQRSELEHIVRERTAEIEHALLHDKLTGLPNRTMIVSRVEHCITRRHRRSDFHFALLFLDFDRFKIINDSLGHEVGDLLLVQVAQRLGSLLRSNDSLARVGTPSRIGGDEFLVLLEELRAEEDAARVAERILEEINRPFVVNEQQLQITCSIGIAVGAHRYESPVEMIRDADTAMYRAKAAGRARYAMFDDAMHSQMVKRLSMEQALRKAVREHEIQVHFQPIASLERGIITGFEALLRWTHSELGPVPASELVGLAEETGLIMPISLYVLRTACRQLRKWQDARSSDAALMMSVNLSRSQFIDPELVEKIASIVKESGIRPGSLVLEVTESMAMDNYAEASVVLKKLSNLGIWLHLDDFGTGYSSLSCLYRLPLSGLKIDRTFIRDVFDRPQNEAVLSAIVNIAQAFHLHVIAEGVETTQQLELLRRLGVDHVQGFLFGRAVSAEDTTALLGSPIAVSAFEGVFANALVP